MPSKVFVANLPKDVRESELKDEFSRVVHLSIFSPLVWKCEGCYSQAHRTRSLWICRV